jgi:hypothetical protein
MKTLKSVTLALALFVTCSFAKASDVPERKLTKTHAINTYVDAMTLGRIEATLTRCLTNRLSLACYAEKAL